MNPFRAPTPLACTSNLTSRKRGRRRLALGLTTGLLAAGCRSEPPSLAVESTAAPEDVPTQAPVDTDLVERSGAWFQAGPGAEGMRLAARGDHEHAVESFARVIAQPANPADAAMAQLLSGLSLVELGRHEEAATAFAKAREDAATAPVDAQVTAMQAQALLDAGQPEPAYQLVASMQPGAGVGPDLKLLQADALARLDRHDEAVAAYQGYLASAAGRRRVHEARAKLARLLEALAEEKEGAARSKLEKDAAELWDRVSLDVPSSDYGREAIAALEGGAEARLGRSAKERKAIATQRELASLRTRLKRRRYAEVIRDAKALARKPGHSRATQCELAFIEASAVFKQRKRAASRPIFDRATPLCKKAGAKDLEVKSRYQGARGRYAEGQFAKAARAFESLAKDHADHTYADDAWIKAGEAWESGGKPSAARNAYRQALSRHPDGDMRHEARRRLLLMAFDDSEPQTALREVEGFLAAKDVGADERARLLYFRGRAKARAGHDALVVKADYLEAIALRPLSYASLQALSRLRAMSDADFAEGLKILEGATSPLPSLTLPGADPGGEARARLWARLGQGERAWEALQELGVKGWPAVALLGEAQAWPEAQRRLANLGTSWRQQVPSKHTRHHWELAHPRPFADLIDRGEDEHGVPRLLTFAIMQTESRFDPDVTSWAGARGLVQLMPATAKDLASRAGVTLRDGDLYRPDINLDLGMRYLARLSARRGGDAGAASLAAPSYNAGAGAVDRWVNANPDQDLDLFIESIPYDETRKYARNVMARWFAYRWLYGEGDAAARVPLLPAKIPAKQ